MPYILLESLQPSNKDAKTLRIRDAETILQCRELNEVIPLLLELEHLCKTGYTAAGFLSYEAGFAFLPNMPPWSQSGFPLVWFALTRTPQWQPPETFINDFESGQAVQIEDLSLNADLPAYREAIESIRRYIENGYTYQVNYTLRYGGAFRGSPGALYRQLRRKQRVNYAAHIETDEWALLSLSPELFFRSSGREILMCPMKGTAPRGRTLQEDEANAKMLRESPKEQSENLMIVDLLRNDLGKICEVGSIQVLEPMRVEKYDTLLQMTSTITGRLREGTGVADIFRATFPSGSVTGAPKVRTMQIIHELERIPRKIYTGAIGFVSAEESVFNVAIRTVLIDRKQNRIEMGVGSGILYEANALREYEECRLKGKFLTDPFLEFQLLETILWDPALGYCRLSLHLDRILQSAEYFLIPLKRESIESALHLEEAKLRAATQQQRIRLLLDREGRIQITSEPVEPLSAEPVKVRFASQTTDSTDRFLFHKTTARSLYELEWRTARSEGYFDVIFRNERNELTEGAITNLMIEKSGIFYTPPVTCGLLAGTCRRHLMETRPFPIEERVLYEIDLMEADAVYLTNAIRGLLRASLA